MRKLAFRSEWGLFGAKRRTGCWHARCRVEKVADDAPHQMQPKRRQIPQVAPRRAYWKAVSEKFLSLRECSRSIGMSANFSIALMPMVRCWATCRS
jgi:hypothetical protein